MKSEEEFDDLFREKLSESSGHYSPENWERMQLLLNASHGAKGAFIWSRLNNMVAVVGVGVGAFVGSQLFFGESTSTKLDFSKTIQRERNVSVAFENDIINENKNEEISITESGKVKEMNKGIAGNTSIVNSKNNFILGSAEKQVATSNSVVSSSRSMDLENNSAEVKNSISPAELKQENNSVAYGSNENAEKIEETETLKSIDENIVSESAKSADNNEINSSVAAGENQELKNVVEEAKAMEEASKTESKEEAPQEMSMANEVKIPAEETPAVITDPIITSNKVLPVNVGFEAGLQTHKPWGENSEGNIGTGYSAGAMIRVQVKPNISLNAQVNFAYRNGVSLPKTSYVYAYDFNLVKIPITVNVNGLATSNLMAGMRYSFGKFGAVEANIGGQFIMDTHAKVSSTVDTIPLPSGNWGYRTGVKRWDWMAGIGYDYGFCRNFEGFANYRFGFNKDNTDDKYFGANRADVNRYFQVGLRYFIKPSEKNAQERFK